MQQTVRRQRTGRPAAAASSSTFSRIKRAPPSPAHWRTSSPGWVSAERKRERHVSLAGPALIFIKFLALIVIERFPSLSPVYGSCSSVPDGVQPRSGSPQCLSIVSLCVIIIQGIWIDPYLPMRRQNNSSVEGSGQCETSAAAICYCPPDLDEQCYQVWKYLSFNSCPFRISCDSFTTFLTSPSAALTAFSR